MRKQSQGGRTTTKKDSECFLWKGKYKTEPGAIGSSRVCKVDQCGFLSEGPLEQGPEGQQSMVCMSIITAFERCGGREIMR